MTVFVEHALLVTTKTLAVGMVIGSIAQSTNDTTITFGNTAFWSFAATVAFIVQLLLQRYYATQAAAKAEVAAEKVEQVATQAAAAAKKVEVVKQTLEITNTATNAKIDEIKDTGDKIHTLVNNSMSVVLNELALVTRRLAEKTGQEADITAANLAQAASDRHAEKQDVVDAEDAKDAKD